MLAFLPTKENVRNLTVVFFKQFLGTVMYNLRPNDSSLSFELRKFIQMKFMYILCIWLCIYHVQRSLHVNALLMGGENRKFLHVQYTEDVHKYLENENCNLVSGMHITVLLNMLSEVTVWWW